jgi:protoporphyrinogen IX oxidase
VTTLYFWIKVLHITAMTVWFAGLLFLPRLLIAHARAAAPEDAPHLRALGQTLYFRVMTPAALLMTGLGLALIAFGFDGVWLPLKLVLVSGLVVLHLHYGQRLLAIEDGSRSQPVLRLRLIQWAPLLGLLAIAALTAAKPPTLPML